MDSLPIDPLLPELCARLVSEGAVVLEAPPGAGKTTRVPRALLQAGAIDGEILVLEPRRLAARLAARRVAEELGEGVGERVGYTVRFEEVSSRHTRIRFVTEGILTRRLVEDPQLRGVGAVLLDEFHERHLQGDVGLALLRALQQNGRRDLRLVVMSATLETEPVATFLGAPVLRSEGRRFDVEIEHAEREDSRPLAQQVAGAVKRLVAGGLEGDVLVFLPGAAEIRRAGEACEEIAHAAALDLVALHGELPPAQQDRAIAPGPRRKVILSTNVAESSITVPGIVAVVDSGLARVASHSPWTGLAQLNVAKVSKASAVQRAGRAGRLREGRCIRLFTRADFESRPAHDAPEIRRLDLTQTVLELRAAGAEPRRLPWFEAPSEPALEAAEELLRRLGALDGGGTLTGVGRRMARLPLHPRLARMVIEGESRRAGEDSALLAAILGERDVRARDLFGPSDPAADPVELLERVENALRRESGEARRFGLEPSALRSVKRAYQQVRRLVERSPSRPHDEGWEQDLRLAILSGFPDRVARKRAPGSRELVLSGGGSAALPVEEAPGAPELLVALDAEERRTGAGRGQVVVRTASHIEPEWLLEIAPEGLADEIELVWNEARERVEARSRLKYGALVLEDRPVDPPDLEAASALLFEKARGAGIRAFADEAALASLQGRLLFLSEHCPELGLPPETFDTEGALALACAGCVSFAELRENPLEQAFRERIAPGTWSRIDRLAPEHVQLPGGRRLRVHYEVGKPPWVESRLQDFFGSASGPTVAGGRVPLVLHLLAPNQRAVQVTSDLAGFWSRHYPSIRRELMRRYPRHAWPEDPLTASPPQRR